MTLRTLLLILAAISLAACPDDAPPAGGDPGSDLGAEVTGDAGADVPMADPGGADPGVADPGVADPGGADPGVADPGADTPSDASDVGPGDAGPGDAAPDAADAGPAPTCAEYCAAVQAACTGGDAQFPDEATCLSFCQDWAMLAAGSAADTTGNTIGCRLSHAQLAAASDPSAHCPHAGFAGGGVCGSWCDNYCGLAALACPAGGPDALYADDAACQAACAGLPDDGAPDAEAGDSVQCRMMQLVLARLTEDPATHCPEAAPDGGATCVAGPDPTCADYCAAVTASCAGDDAQYASEADCLALCGTGLWELGSASDGGSNTVGCRLNHATLAASGDAAAHCPHAGPSGGGVCGSWCEGYCDAVVAACAPGSADEVFGDAASCLTACDAAGGAGFPDSGAAGDTTGDTVQCRLTHALLAVQDPAAHCGHAAVAPTGFCLEPTCEAYCDAVMANCGGADAQYESQQQCLDSCQFTGAWPAGTVLDSDVNTLGCRLTHAQLAAAEPATHCPHAGATGGGVCGSWCDSYCQLTALSCGPTSGAALYADDAECQAACAGLPAGGAIGDLTGDSIQCRLQHLAMSWADPSGHCPAAGAAPTSYCLDVDCAGYCAAIGAACTGSDAQYADDAACLAFCQSEGALPMGVPGELSGNTLSCRQAHTQLAAAGAAATHCPHAGPSGGGVCGGWCDTYCDLMALNCPGAYADGAACQATCAGFDAGGAAGDAYGSTVQCRITYAGAPAAGDAAACDAAGAAPSGPCVTPSCDTYCSRIQAECGGANTQYASLAACLDQCWSWAGLPPGSADPTELSSNTIGCRLNHLDLAAQGGDAATECPIAGAAGGGVCGGWCDVYCDLADRNCAAVGPLYADRTACVGACAGLTADAPFWPLAPAGDTLQCRLAQLIAAGDPAGDAATSCVEGGADASTVCVALGLGGGETCAAATAVTALPFFASGDTAGAADDLTASASCPGFDSPQAGGRDAVYVFTPATSGPFAFALTGPDVLFIATDCGDLGNTCVGFHDFFLAGTYEVTLTPGVAHYVVVDGFNAANAGQYTLSITSACAPDCAGKACGADGCGGVCGICAGGQACDGAGQCVDPTAVPGNTCANPFSATAVPFSAGASTVGASNDAAGPAACLGGAGDAGAQSGDQVTLFTPPATWLYDVAVTPQAGFDVALYAAQTCADVAGSCLGGADAAGAGGAETLRLPAAAATPVALFVDGGDDAGGPLQGAYTLAITEVDPSCAAYCALITDACPGADAQYGSESECLAVCASSAGTSIALGTPAQSGGNSLSCRMTHALLAAAPGGAATHCPHAGPTGGGVCGDYCLVYCQMTQAVCTGGDAQYASESECLTTCSQTLALDGAPGDLTGDTVQCRLSHAMLAASTGALATHCPHAGPAGGGVCVDASAASGLLISELDAVTDAGGDTLEFFELYNSRASSLSLATLAGVYVTLVDESGAIAGSWDLGATLASDIPAGGFVVFGSNSLTATVSGAQAIALGASDLLADGLAQAAGVALTQGDPSAGPVLVLDALAYGGDLAAAPAWWGGSGPGAAADTGATVALARCPTGADSDDSSADFALATPTPGADNVCPTVSYAGDVVPIVSTYCAPCHTGAATAMCSGGGCWISWADTQLASYHCPGGTKAECWPVRIEAGTMPQGAPGTVAPADLQALKDWIAEGMLDN